MFFFLPLFWLHNPSFCVTWAYPICLHIFCNLSSLSLLSSFCLLLIHSSLYCCLTLIVPLCFLYNYFHPSFTPPPPHPFFHHCFSPLPFSDVRLRVRAEYLEHESALRNGVSSDKRQPLERQFELFSQANSLLRARDLGSIVCDIKFTELDNLEAFWGDYLSGALLEALKGVFITDSLRMAAGTEGVRLLISVDQDDYEEGRRLLNAKKIQSSRNGGRTETHRAL